MSLLGNSLMKVSPDQIILKKNKQQMNLLGYVYIQNICDSKIAVKMKSNNPTQYIVAPSQVILDPQQKEKISFTKNGHSLSNIQYKQDKFQFIAAEVENQQIQTKNAQKKVDDSIFGQKDRRSQKIVLEVQICGDQNQNISNLIGSVENLDNNGKIRNSQTQLQGKQSPQVRVSSSKNNQVLLPSNSNSDIKYNKNIPSISSSQLKNPMSPQYSKSTIFDKDKVYKQEYERLIQKVHEYEKNFQQLDQEIKMTKNEKEKWDQIQQTPKSMDEPQQDYEAWHLILVILVSMFIGVLWAK